VLKINDVCIVIEVVGGAAGVAENIHQ